jgi:choline dehydrogenase-like flavoprotein
VPFAVSLSISCQKFSWLIPSPSRICWHAPLWNELLGRNLITGHPMGGCVMADDARGGVVDSAGRVYSSDAGTAVHPGLWVMDAAVIPRSLGANPGLTIAALGRAELSPPGPRSRLDHPV